jgi:hypothetical protein
MTRAVFHAPMFALNADAEWNACEPYHPRSTADGKRSHVSARMRGRPIAHAHARARTQHVGACVRRARIGDPFVLVARRACIWIHACIMYRDTYTVCVFHRWMALRRECVALAHMPRIRASSAPARDRTRTQGYTRAYPFTYPDFASIYAYVCINTRRVRWLYIQAIVPAHVMATVASSARAIARTCAFEVVQPHARPYPSLTQVYIFLYIYV